MAEPKEDGLLGTLSKLLDGVGEVSDVADGVRYEAGEVKADAEGVAGRAIYGMERIERGRNAIKRLRDPERKEKPGKAEMALETWNFLFGDGKE